MFLSESVIIRIDEIDLGWYNTSMQRKYEVAIVLSPDLEAVVANSKSKVEASITELGGKIVDVDEWGKRRLAYPIKKHEWGIYYFFYVKIDPKDILELETKFRYNQEILRFLVTRQEENK